jgi:hypothetical protein
VIWRKVDETNEVLHVAFVTAINPTHSSVAVPFPANRNDGLNGQLLLVWMLTGVLRTGSGIQRNPPFEVSKTNPHTCV